MTASVAKLTFVLLAVGWYAIRFEHARRSRRVAVRRDLPRFPRKRSTVDIAERARNLAAALRGNRISTLC